MASAPVIAHRGHAAVCPENTLSALRSAVAHGAAYIEFDLQLTADHVPVLLHDANLLRTAGIDREIFTVTSSQARTICVGEPSRLGARFPAEMIATLDDAVLWLSEQPDVLAFVEIKRESADHFGVATTVEPVVRALQPVLEQCVVISFDPRCLQHARDLGVNRLGFCARALDKRNELLARGLGVQYVLIDHKIYPDDGSVALWPGPWQWAAYEIVDPDLARRLQERGIDLIETMAVPEIVGAF